MSPSPALDGSGSGSGGCARMGLASGDAPFVGVPYVTDPSSIAPGSMSMRCAKGPARWDFKSCPAPGVRKKKGQKITDASNEESTLGEVRSACLNISPDISKPLA